MSVACPAQFEEQQAFDKSRKFLRQLEICFAENPAHHQKIIKVLQSCADCVPQEIAEVTGPAGASFSLQNAQNCNLVTFSLLLETTICAVSRGIGEAFL